MLVQDQWLEFREHIQQCFNTDTEMVLNGASFFYGAHAVLKLIDSCQVGLPQQIMINELLEECDRFKEVVRSINEVLP